MKPSCSLPVESKSPSCEWLKSGNEKGGGTLPYRSLEVPTKGPTASTIAPPPKKKKKKRAIFFNERTFHDCSRHQKGCDENNAFVYLVACKGLPNDDVGVARGAAFQEIQAGVGFKTGDFVKPKFGGAAVVRLGPPYISKTVVSKIGFVTYIYDNGRSCDYYPKKRFEMAGFLKSFNIDLTIQVFLQKKKFFTFLVPQGHSCHFSLETSSFFLRK